MFFRNWGYQFDAEQVILSPSSISYQSLQKLGSPCFSRMIVNSYALGLVRFFSDVDQDSTRAGGIADEPVPFESGYKLVNCRRF
jgi:hypothetical protein